MNANKMATNSFIQYFRINGLTLLILESLCRTECGLNYMSEKSEVTKALIKCLTQASFENLNQLNQMDGSMMIQGAIFWAMKLLTRSRRNSI